MSNSLKLLSCQQINMGVLLICYPMLRSYLVLFVDNLWPMRLWQICSFENAELIITSISVSYRSYLRHSIWGLRKPRAQLLHMMHVLAYDFTGSVFWMISQFKESSAPRKQLRCSGRCSYRCMQWSFDFFWHGSDSNSNLFLVFSVVCHDHVMRERQDFRQALGIKSAAL